jgi:predicted nucleic-acid-binding protein
MLLRDLF